MNTKQQLVELSANLLREHGFDGFSYLDLARALGISKASVHHHFPKKQDLGLALCEWTHLWLIQGLDHFDAKADSQWNKLERYLQTAMKHALTDHKMCPLSALHSDLPKLSEDMIASLKDLDKIELDWVTKVMEEGQANGEFVGFDNTKGMAGLFIFGCKGSIYNARLHGKDLLQQTIKQFKTLLLKNRN